MKPHLFVLLIGFHYLLPAQNAAKIWYFGEQAVLDFRSGTPSPNFGPLLFPAGSSVATDKKDNLLFYTDGEGIYNRFENAMVNGLGLNGNRDAVTPSAVVMISNFDSIIYYVFTCDALGGPKGLQYSIVNMSKQLGDGEVVKKNIFIQGNVAEKLVGITHSNHCNAWLISHELGSARFFAYPITESGVGFPIISNVGSLHVFGSGAWGQMNASSDGKMIAMAYNYGNEFQLFKFDNTTGIISDAITIGPYSKPWGVVFSPDSKKLYTSQIASPDIYQFDLSLYNQADINSSAILIGSVTATDPNLKAGAMQLGPDNKIYIPVQNSNYLSVIDKPNLSGAACSFIDRGVDLSFFGRSKFGLPNYTKIPFDPNFKKSIVNINIFGNDTILCPPFSYKLKVNHPYPVWSNNSTSKELYITKPGTYWVSFEDCSTIYVDTIHIMEANCPQYTDTCSLYCTKIKWANWTMISKYTYVGDIDFGQTQIATMDLDTASAFPIAIRNLEFANSMLSPQIVPYMPTPFMPGNGVHILRHKIKFNVKNVQDLIFLIAAVPNSKHGFNSIQHTKISAFDLFNQKLDVSNVKLKCNDPTFSNSINTQVNFSANEIDLTVDNAFNLKEGDALLFGDFPVNTSYIIVEHNDDQSYTWDSEYYTVGLPDCPAVTCEPECKKMEWMKWNKQSNKKYGGSVKRGSVTLDLDPLTSDAVSGLTSVSLASTQYTPKNIDLMPTLYMPGLPGVKTLIHKLNFDNVANPSEAFILVGSFPNENKPGFTLKQIGKIRAYDSLNTQLILTDVCEVFQDRLSTLLSAPNSIQINNNEISISVNDPSGNDGSVVIFKGFPNNTRSIEIEHFDELSLNSDGIFINVGFHDCCETNGKLDYSYLQCKGDTSFFTLIGKYTFSNPPATGFIIVKVDSAHLQTFNPPFSFPLDIHISGLPADGQIHTIVISTSDYSDCFQSFTFIAPLPNREPAPRLMSSNSPICENDTLHLYSVPGLRYNWSGPNNYSSNLQNPAILTGMYFDWGKPGLYFVSVTDFDGCVYRDSADIKVFSSSQKAISLSACDSITINSQFYKTSGIYDQVLSNTKTCDSLLIINLSILKSSSSKLFKSTCDSVIVNGQIYDQTGDYSQILKNGNGCDSNITVTVNLLKSVTTDLALTACDSILVNAVKYYTSGLYQQKLINNNGCDSILNLNLTINGNTSLPEAGRDTSICEGEIIKLNGAYSGQASFLWQSFNGSFDNPTTLSTNYYPNTIGDHRIYFLLENECGKLADSLTISVLPKQFVQIIGDTIIDPCQEITFAASGGTNYIWTPASLIECLDPACATVRLKSNSAIKFTISSNDPCSVPANLNLSLSQSQSDVYVPNVFSPNGDNINDFFKPVINCNQLDYYSLQIFDRWGSLVFESFNKEIGWNGKFHSENLNPGVYTYVIQYQFSGSTRKIKSGDVTLLK